MPIYEYKCEKCRHQMEVWQKFSDPPTTKCELCNGKMRKLISHSAFHLKGTGWYVTDYASKRGGDEGRDVKPKKDSATKEAKGSTDKSKQETSSTSTKKAKD
ncbi:MAG: zinc ribbon domain-containing protein [Deltaproteobacteria bacterium]|nr:zinc ribbon domain-containing protein [Deltaproteobacteria bacterium]